MFIAQQLRITLFKLLNILTSYSGKIESIELAIISIAIVITVVIIIGILWVTIIRLDVMDRISIWSLILFGGADTHYASTRDLQVRFLKARLSGEKIDDTEFNELSELVRNDKCRRAWYSIGGMILAISIAAFGSLIVYNFIQAANRT